MGEGVGSGGVVVSDVGGGGGVRSDDGGGGGGVFRILLTGGVTAGVTGGVAAGATGGVAAGVAGGFGVQPPRGLLQEFIWHQPPEAIPTKSQPVKPFGLQLLASEKVSVTTVVPSAVQYLMTLGVLPPDPSVFAVPQWLPVVSVSHVVGGGHWQTHQAEFTAASAVHCAPPPAVLSGFVLYNTAPPVQVVVLVVLPLVTHWPVFVTLPGHLHWPLIHCDPTGH